MTNKDGWTIIAPNNDITDITPNDVKNNDITTNQEKQLKEQGYIGDNECT